MNEIARAREVSAFLTAMGRQSMDRRGAYAGTHETDTSRLYKDAARFVVMHADQLEALQAATGGEG